MICLATKKGMEHLNNMKRYFLCMYIHMICSKRRVTAPDSESVESNLLS
jgi:hypothetical protein